MTRSFNVNLTNSGQWYNLWDFITALPGFDPTMSNGIFYPSMVSQLVLQSDNSNTGKIVTISQALNKLGGIELAVNDKQEFRGDSNIVDIKGTFLRTDVGGAQINVSLVSH